MRGNLEFVLMLISPLDREQSFTILMVLRKCFTLSDFKTHNQDDFKSSSI